MKQYPISIHALVKRATLIILCVQGMEVISIHALVKRATRVVEFDSYEEADFNPRPREEGDFAALRSCLEAMYFNPRPREEGDVKITNI